MRFLFFRFLGHKLRLWGVDNLENPDRHLFGPIVVFWILLFAVFVPWFLSEQLERPGFFHRMVEEYQAFRKERE